MKVNFTPRPRINKRTAMEEGIDRARLEKNAPRPKPRQIEGKHGNAWDELARMRQENADLRAQLQTAQELQARTLSEKNGIERELSDAKATQERLKRALAKLAKMAQQSDETQHEREIAHLQNRIDRRNARILELEEELKQKARPIELEKIKNRLDRAKEQLKRMKQLETEKAELEARLFHCESEYEVLNDILSITERDPITAEWTNLRNHLRREKDLKKKLIESEKLMQMKTEKLEDEMSRQSSVLVDEMSQQTEDFNKQVDDLHRKVDDLEAINAKIGRFEEQQKIRMSFARALARTEADVLKKLGQFHDAVLGETEEPMLRPLVISVVLLVRWGRLYQHTMSTAYDPMSLMAMARIPTFSFSGQVDELIRQFVALTNEVATLKEQLNEAEAKTTSLRKEIDVSSVKGDGTTELDTLKKTLEAQKARMETLQEELALAVPPQKMQESITKITSLELELDSKNEQIAELERTLEDKTYLLSQLNMERKERMAEIEAKDDELQELESISESRCKEIELLKMRLSEKTKELLALERLVGYKQPVIPTPLCSPLRMDVEESPKINPAFLGKTE